MTKYREILRLKSQGVSERSIALSCGISRNTVAKVTSRAQELDISWPLDESKTNAVLDELMFPKIKTTHKKRLPDCSYIRKELQRSGVKLSPSHANFILVLCYFKLIFFLILT